MSHESPKRDRARLAGLAAVGAVALAVVALMAWLAHRGAGSPGSSGAEKFAAFEGAADAGAPLAASSAREASVDVGRQVRLPDAGSAGTIMRPDVGALTRRDAGTADASQDTAPEWTDPTNQRVLGHRSWMVQASDAQTKALDKVLDRKPPQPYPYAMKVRRNGIDVARGIVDDCFDRLLQRQPDATGRLTLAFDLVATGERGVFRKIRLPAIVKLHDPQFQDCITGGLANASFATSEQGVMRVQYPFFFDGADQPRTIDARPPRSAGPPHP